MTKEEAKQYIRFLIYSCVKIQSKYNKTIFYLYYNKQYLRAKKLSKITGKTVNENNFKGGDVIFWFDAKYKTFWYYSIIRNYLYYNYSNDYLEQQNIIKEVFNEYDEYKDYNVL